MLVSKLFLLELLLSTIIISVKATHNEDEEMTRYNNAVDFWNQYGRHQFREISGLRVEIIQNNDKDSWFKWTQRIREFAVVNDTQSSPEDKPVTTTTNGTYGLHEYEPLRYVANGAVVDFAESRFNSPFTLKLVDLSNKLTFAAIPDFMPYIEELAPIDDCGDMDLMKVKLCVESKCKSSNSTFWDTKTESCKFRLYVKKVCILLENSKNLWQIVPLEKAECFPFGYHNRTEGFVYFNRIMYSSNPVPEAEIKVELRSIFDPHVVAGQLTRGSYVIQIETPAQAFWNAIIGVVSFLVMAWIKVHADTK